MGGSEDLCCGIMGEQWSCFCSKMDYECTVRDHRKKMWKYTDMLDGYYINNPVTCRAFLEPCLPKMAALRSLTFNDLLKDREGKSLETWTSIFRHLTGKAKEVDAHTPVRGGRARDGEDPGLIEFAMAMKTPSRVAFDSLNSPKHARPGTRRGETRRRTGPSVWDPPRGTCGLRTYGLPWPWSMGSWDQGPPMPIMPRYTGDSRGSTRRSHHLMRSWPPRPQLSALMGWSRTPTHAMARVPRPARPSSSL